MFLLPHLLFLCYLCRLLDPSPINPGGKPLVWLNPADYSPGFDKLAFLSACLIALLFLLFITVLVILHVIPYWSKNKLAVRVKILYGGQRILHLCYYGILFQILFYLAVFFTDWYPLSRLKEDLWLFIADAVFCFCFYYFLLLNGCIRILCTCRRLGIVKRILILLFLWVPVVNLFLLHELSRRAREEFDQELCRFEHKAKRADSNVCAARYPIIMLHGIGFRDLRWFNYWGRIPKELVRNGAVVYYGHQQAWGTLEDNAAIIKEKIESVLEENHCDQVNIIAHSRGGLDARYVISGLHMERQVASLTTISTPHRGSELLTVLNRLPDSIYHFIASLFDKAFRKLGDTNPDCYCASKELSPEFCRDFNEKYPDSPLVYYQSYASVVKHTFGDSLLSIPNLLMYLAGASKNDGLVTVESAKWGNFRGTFESTGRRGISHGDMIDLKREDYKGFDVIEAYVGIVSELKDMGF